MAGERPVLSLKRKLESEAETPKPLRLGKKVIVEATRPNKKKKDKRVKTPLTAPVKPAPIKVNKPPRPKHPQRTVSLADAETLLAQWWPTLLTDGGHPRLMKQGIRADFHQDIALRQLPVSHKHLHRCLKAITRTPGYLGQSVVLAPRYDLQGKPCGTVTPEEQQFAWARLSAIWAQRRIITLLSKITEISNVGYTQCWFRWAQTILAGIELIHMIRKGQYQSPQSDGLSPAEQFYLLEA